MSFIYNLLKEGEKRVLGWSTLSYCVPVDQELFGKYKQQYGTDRAYQYFDVDRHLKWSEELFSLGLEPNDIVKLEIFANNGTRNLTGEITSIRYYTLEDYNKYGYTTTNGCAAVIRLKQKKREVFIPVRDIESIELIRKVGF